MKVIERDIVGAVIFDKNGKIFLAKKASGGVWPDTWQIPGGGVEQNEDNYIVRILEEKINYIDI